MNPKVENVSKIMGCEDEKRVELFLKYNEVESFDKDRFIETTLTERIKIEKEDSDQKKSNQEFFNIPCEKVRAESNDSNIDTKCDNDIIETKAIKKGINDVNEITTKELNCCQENPYELKIIEMEEVHIKDEDDNENSLNKQTRKFGNQLMLHQCPQCPYKTDFKDRLKRHSVVHKKPDEIDWYCCQECSYKTCRKGSLKNHVNTHKSEEERLEKKIHQCPECPFKTSRKYSLKSHIEAHKNKREKLQIHQCPECPFKTHRAYVIEKHILAHKSDSFKCSECSYQSRTKWQLSVHQVKHERVDKWHSCPLCPYKSNAKSGLRKHCRRRHSIDPNNPKQIEILKCPECSYQGVHRYELKRHQLTHNQSSWFQCPDCDFKARYKSSVKKHQVHHQGENVKCWLRCQECPYKSLDKTCLKKHLITHKPAEEIQWLECSQCSFKTAHKTSLRQHQLMHKEAHEIEWFCCYKCAFKTKHKSNLVKHISKHKK